MENFKPERPTEQLLRLVAENPTLPIIAMVDSDVVSEDYGRWLASIGYVSVGEYTCYNERYYDDREEFKEDYYGCNAEAICEKFGYNPWHNDYALDIGQITKEQYDGNEKSKLAMDHYLDDVADRAFSKAIIINIDTPSDEDYKDFIRKEIER